MTQEVESDLDGVLAKIVVPEGDVEVGATVAVIEADGASQRPAESPGERLGRGGRADDGRRAGACRDPRSARCEGRCPRRPGG